jgi:SAM-dependent methyltransferase
VNTAREASVSASARVHRIARVQSTQLPALSELLALPDLANFFTAVSGVTYLSCRIGALSGLIWRQFGVSHPKPLSAEYFDGWYADRVATPTVDEIMKLPDAPAIAYSEIRRVLKSGGRVVLTSWEPLDRDDERISPRVRRANPGAGLRQAGFPDVEVRDRPAWLEREHALWEEATALDPGDDPALRSFHAEGVKSLQRTGLGPLRRVLAVATEPQ